MTPKDIAPALARFGSGLNVVGLLASRRAAQAAGLEGHETLAAQFGVREIGADVVVLDIVHATMP